MLKANKFLKAPEQHEKLMDLSRSLRRNSDEDVTHAVMDWLGSVSLLFHLPKTVAPLDLCSGGFLCRNTRTTYDQQCATLLALSRLLLKGRSSDRRVHRVQGGKRVASVISLKRFARALKSLCALSKKVY